MKKYLLFIVIAAVVATSAMAGGDEDMRGPKLAPPPLVSSANYARSPVLRTAKDDGGRLISLNFSNIKTRELLQIFAQFTGLNFVISDNVKGSMSIHLNKIPWKQAMSAILRSQALGKKRFGTIVLIAPLTELAAREIQQLQAQQKMKQLERDSKIQAMQAKKRIDDLVPLYNTILTLRYGKAKQIAKLLASTSGSLLAPRGQVSVDERTNSLWIRAPLKQLYKVKKLIQKLDFPVKQVLIAARIVTIDKPFEKELGVRFGVTSPRHLSGTLAGANQLADGTQPGNITPITDRLNFDLPAAPLFGRPWSLGMAVAKLGGDSVLDLELSALQRDGKIQLVSTPSLITSDNQAAYIQTGEEIPYQVATSSGATAIEYKNAVLKLTVTPQITSAKRVILKLKVSNNRRGDVITLTGGGQAIPIVTEEEESQVLLNNAQTIVLGGIYTQDKRNVTRRVPFLSNIPVIGNLFKHKVIRNNRKELLIFLTPHIIKDPKQYVKTKQQQIIWEQTKEEPVVKNPGIRPKTRLQLEQLSHAQSRLPARYRRRVTVPRRKARWPGKKLPRPNLTNAAVEKYSEPVARYPSMPKVRRMPNPASETRQLPQLPVMTRTARYSRNPSEEE